MFHEAQQLFPGGVNSPVRAFKSVGGEPIFFARGEGAELHDVDGNRYVDFVLSWGPLALGHAHPAVIAAIREAAENGTSFGAPHGLELVLARLIQRSVPSMERMRFTSSGTEAVMSALRLARAYTGRQKIVKFEGCYHGHADAMLVRAGSGVATLGLPDSPGVNSEVAANTLVAPFNDLDAVARIFERHRGEVAAVIVEPVAGNMGVVPPAPGFLDGLRSVTAAEGALLIFDEVMTGFRVHPGGAQALYGVVPDLTTLAKVIGGGLPVGAYGGRREIMELIAPAGPVYQAGTLSGNPLAMAAGAATLTMLQQDGVWNAIADATTDWCAHLEGGARDAGVDLQVQRVGTMFTPFFTAEPVTDWTTARRADTARYGAFFHTMLDRGVYLPPSQFEAGFLSTAHSARAVARSGAAARDAFAAVARRAGVAV
jgi:glutamate-1-semialdehyde 2,1-aminomutase